MNPKDRRVVLVESILADTRLKNELVKVLFQHFEVLSILFAPSHLMPIFGLGLQNGLVLDVGYNSASVIPIYQGVPILRAWQALPLGGRVIRIPRLQGTFIMQCHPRMGRSRRTGALCSLQFAESARYHG